MTELVDLTATEQRGLIGKREVSATELLDAHLARIDAVNPRVNAIVALDPDIGRRRARHVDDAIAAGDDPGPLAGLVTAHKDLTETADFTTTFGSPLFAGYRPAADSLLVARMKAAGAVADWQDERAGVRCGLAHVQRGLRRDAQPMGTRSQRRWLERRRGRVARLSDGRHRRWQ